MRLVLVDSYDSFTHNLVQAFEVLGAEVTVVRSDRLDVARLVDAGDAFVLGPGPGHPLEAGRLVEAARWLGERRPLLGVCLGQQAIGLAWGARVVRHRPVHGKASAVRHDGEGLFDGLPSPVPMTRYHSLVVELAPGSDLVGTAWSEDGALMALRHRELPVRAVQFHPESVLSGDAGMRLLGNFLRIARGGPAAPG